MTGCDDDAGPSTARFPPLAKWGNLAVKVGHSTILGGAGSFSSNWCSFLSATVAERTSRVLEVDLEAVPPLT